MAHETPFDVWDWVDEELIEQIETWKDLLWAVPCLYLLAIYISWAILIDTLVGYSYIYRIWEEVRRG